MNHDDPLRPPYVWADKLDNDQLGDIHRLRSRVVAAYRRHGLLRRAERCQQCGEHVLATIEPGELGLNAQGELEPGFTACRVFLCPLCGGPRRWTIRRNLADGFDRAGDQLRGIYLNALATQGPSDTYRRVRWLKLCEVALFRSAHWKRLVGRRPGHPYAWALANEVTYAASYPNVHALGALVIVDPTAFDPAKQRWAKLTGGELILKKIQNNEAWASYMTKGFRSTVSKPMPPHINATDEDLDDLIRLSVEKFQWIRGYGEWSNLKGSVRRRPEDEPVVARQRGRGAGGGPVSAAGARRLNRGNAMPPRRLFDAEGRRAEFAGWISAEHDDDAGPPWPADDRSAPPADAEPHKEQAKRSRRRSRRRAAKVGG